MGNPVYTQTFPTNAYQPGGNVSTIIQSSDMIRRMWLNIKSQPTMSSGNNTVANTQPGDDLAGMNFQLKANGADSLLDVSGQQLFVINQWILSKNSLLNPPLNANLGDGATANPSLSTTLQIPCMACPRNARQSDTWLWANPLKNLTLFVRYPVTAAAINANATGYTTNPTATFILETSTPGVSQAKYRINQSNGTVSQVPASVILPGYGSRWIQQSQTFAGAGNNQQIQLPTGYLGYARILIQATTTASPPVDTGGLITNVQVKNGTQVLWDVPEDLLNSFCRDGGYRNQNQQSTGIVKNNNGKISISSSQAGWYMLDFIPDGRLEESIVTAGNTNLTLNFNFSAACTVNLANNQILKLVNGNPSP